MRAKTSKVSRAFLLKKLIASSHCLLVHLLVAVPTSDRRERGKMADEQPSTAARRRGRGAEASARSEALERLKARLRGGRRSDGDGFQFKLEDPIYDTVPEDEYNALVAKRREEARGFIVDDDGLGYGDEGEEEDWSKAGFTLSSEESDGESEKPKRKKVEKKDPQPKRSSSLSAAAAMMGAQRLSSMFTSSVFKKSRDDKAKGLSCDSIVDDVIAEFAPDETDRLRRRRGPTNPSYGSNNTLPIKNVKSEEPSIGCPDPMGGALLSDVAANGVLESIRLVKNDGCALGSEQNEGEVKEEAPTNKSEDDKIFNSKNGQASIMQTHDDPTNGDVTEEKMLKDLKVEAQQTMEKEVFPLNAKVIEEDPSLSATAGWQAARIGGNVNVADPKVANEALNCEENLEFNLEADGSLPFYVLDAHEEFYGANMGTLYLFGKVKAGNSYQSCCVVVKNMQRCVYAVPSRPLHYTDEMMKLEKDVEESRISSTDFHKKLQDLVSGVKNEIAKQLLDLNVSTFSMAPVKRKYAFERSEIPAGENYVLKINYPFKDPPLSVDLKGESFCALLGTHCSALEVFLIKRKIKGPSWLLVSNFSTCSASQRVSWCKFEVTVDSPKDIRISTSSKFSFEIPPVVVTAVNLKTTINEKQSINEIVSASIVCCRRVKVRLGCMMSVFGSLIII